MTPQLVAAEASRLAREVSRHKAAIRRHREELGAAKAALDALAAECHRLGIQLVIAPIRPIQAQE
jgi:hypothetical protein